MFNLKGGCHCGNISVDIQLADSPNTYSPRACDCDFCRKHGASYVSDPKGSLQIRIKDQKLLGKYQQGSGSADFLFCLKCGVLIGVCYQDAKKIFAAINSKIVSNTSFDSEKTVSPKALSPKDKVSRWREVWFPNVSIEMGTG